MKNLIKLSEIQKKAAQELFASVNAADVNLKNQQDKMGAFLIGIGAEVGKNSKINITEEGMEIENEEAPLVPTE